MRISDWSSDVCSSDLDPGQRRAAPALGRGPRTRSHDGYRANADVVSVVFPVAPAARRHATHDACRFLEATAQVSDVCAARGHDQHRRSEEHTSELQSLMRISYAVFCLKKKNEDSLNK